MGTGSATGADGKIYVSVVFCTETSPSSAAASPPPPAEATTPPPSAPRATTTPDVAPVQASPAAAPVAVSVLSFEDVFYRLFTGDLDERWITLTGSSSGLLVLAPSLFVSPAFWTVLNRPAIS